MTRATAALALWIGLAAGAACDPVHDDAVAALGGEAPGVRRGPLHRPGQPCLLCHDGALGDPPEFTVAGTVFDREASTQPVNGAIVAMHDAKGSPYEAVTNAAGNFYVTPDEWTPAFPLTVAVTTAQGVHVTMHTDVGRDGACASCHVDPAGPGSPGRICITLEDGGTPP
jgi:hypothetical protein